MGLKAISSKSPLECSFNSLWEDMPGSAKNEDTGAISETMDLYGVTPPAGTLYLSYQMKSVKNLI